MKLQGLALLAVLLLFSVPFSEHLQGRSAPIETLQEVLIHVVGVQRSQHFLWANHGIGCPQGGLGPHSPWYPPTLAFMPGENLII